MSGLRIGLLGASRIAPAAVIAPARVRADVEIVAVAARDPERARAYAGAHGIAGVSETYAALVTRDDIDLVYLALPPAAHLEWTLQALAAGKAVLCEKPFAMNADEALRMVEAARAARLPLIEAFHYRFHRVMREARAVVAGGALGRLRQGRAVFDAPIPRRPDELRWIHAQGGGGLMDLGCYCVHALRTLLGAEPHVISATADVLDGVDAVLTAGLEFPGGPVAEIACAMIAERPRARLTLEGERGSLDIENFLAPQMGGRFTVTVDGRAEARSMEGPTTYAAQMDHVVEVMAGRIAPLTGGGDAVANMAAIDAIYAKARSEAG
jgi:predicted dehydrogenase